MLFYYDVFHHRNTDTTSRLSTLPLDHHCFDKSIKNQISNNISLKPDRLQLFLAITSLVPKALAHSQLWLNSFSSVWKGRVVNSSDWIYYVYKRKRLREACVEVEVSTTIIHTLWKFNCSVYFGLKNSAFYSLVGPRRIRALKYRFLERNKNNIIDYVFLLLFNKLHPLKLSVITTLLIIEVTVVIFAFKRKLNH